MKRFVFFLGITLAIVIPVAIHAGWAKTYGGLLDDMGWFVEPTSDGGYIIAATTTDTTTFKEDCWLIKTDAVGDTQWTRTFGDELQDDIHSVIQTTDGQYIVLGQKRKVKTKDMDMMLYKFDSDGNLLWEHNYGGEKSDYAGTDVIQTSDGGFILTGFRDYPNEGCGWGRFWLVKTDSSGQEMWEKTYGYADEHSAAFSIQKTADGDFIAAGDRMNMEFLSMFLLRINKDGDSLWSRTYNFGIGSSGYLLRRTEDENYVITGLTYMDSTANSMRACLAEIDDNGDLNWVHHYGEDKECLGFALEMCSDGGIIMIGTINSSYSNEDIYLVKTDSEGNVEWERTYDGGDSDHGCSVRQTPDGGYIISGCTEVWGKSFQVWLLKTDEYGNVDNVEEAIVTDKPGIHLVSPIGREIVLRYTDCPDGFHGQVFDASGRMVDQIHADEESGTITWGECYGPGVYFIKVNTNQTPRTCKVILVD